MRNPVSNFFRNTTINILKNLLDYSYKREENKEISEMHDKLLKELQDSNKWQGKHAIYYMELVKLNRVVAKKSFANKQLRAKLARAKEIIQAYNEEFPGVWDDIATKKRDKQFLNEDKSKYKEKIALITK